MVPTTSPLNPHQQTPFTNAERIRDLLQIDASIPALLRSASIALADLAPSPSSPISLEASKQNFETHARALYDQIQAVSARLRRQIYALEEAGIVAAEAEVLVPAAPVRGGVGQQRGGVGKVVEAPMVVTNGGLGGLDVGWLNSRRDVVGRGKEVELWEEARVVVVGLVGKGREDEVVVRSGTPVNRESQEHAGGSADGMEVDGEEAPDAGDGEEEDEFIDVEP